jgi:hypothetical protein
MVSIKSDLDENDLSSDVCMENESCREFERAIIKKNQ